jgi:hypothetical protein
MQPVQLMIIGAPKCGTTSLKFYLSQHPEICSHQQPEMMYFTDDSIYAQGYQRSFERYFGDGCRGKRILAKNVGIMYLPYGLNRLRDHNADLQIIISLRHPVERAYSAYWYARRRGWENLQTFEEGIQADPSRFNNDVILARNCTYIDRSVYIKYLAYVYQEFNKDQVHIFLLDDIKFNPEKICESIYGFVGLPSTSISNYKRRINPAALPRYQSMTWLLSSRNPLPTTLRRSVRRLIPDRLGDNLRKKALEANEIEFSPPKMRDETRFRLIEYFKPYNRELSSLLGRDLSSWNI